MGPDTTASDFDSSPTPTRSWIPALVCGILAFVASLIIYWLVVPGLVLGLAAVALGWRARRKGHREFGSVAITLGIAAVLIVPAALSIANEAEKWGRDCALDPTHDPNC